MTQEQLRSILSENIKIRRKKLNISQSKLAEMINMSSNYVTDIETQRTWVSDSTLVKIVN
jgi:transcriptional regulator with XRE-family HTH domain